MRPSLREIRACVGAIGLVILPLVVSFFAVSVSYDVAQAAVVQRIDVRGNSRMDADTIRSYILIKPGKRFSNADIDTSVKALFATGLFADVSIYQTGSTLIVEVDENATVNKVFFEGNKRLKDVVLQGSIQTRPRSIYNDQVLAADVDRILDAYNKVGRDDASVDYEVVPLANDRVNVVFRIAEGGKTKIREIIFIGNNSFSDRRLRDVITTKQSNILSFLSTSDIYDPNRIEADQELLRRYYFNKGFADFQIISATADLDPVENEYVVTFTFDEGVRYNFGTILIESTIPGVSSDSLYDLLETRTGDYYSAKDVEDSIIAITERVAESGYAFVEVTPRGNRNFDTNTIDVAYLVDEGARIYVEDIKIIGNDRTRDYVIRREFELSEGDAYNQVLIQKTKKRLEALDFFEKVDISTRPGSTPDRVVLLVRLLEKATGEFSIGGGYSASDGPVAEISFKEKNFLGRGQYIALKAGRGENDTTYGFSFTEPYFLGQRMSFGFNVSYQESEESSRRLYNTDTISGSLSLGVPLNENTNVQVFYSASSSDITINSNRLDLAPIAGPLPNSVMDEDGIQGNVYSELSAALAPFDGNWISSGFGFGLTYSDFDDDKNPTQGIYAKFTQAFYGAGGDAQYSKTDVTVSGYIPISAEFDVVGFGRVRGGHIESFGNNFRPQDNYYNSTRSIRGFDSAGIGARDPVTGDALGGRTHFNATAELQFPLPFIPESMGFRGALFADAGTVFNLDDTAINRIEAANPLLTAAQKEQLTDSSIRASVGGSIIWTSPFGPLRFDYAFPIAEREWDTTRNFNFGISSKF